MSQPSFHPTTKWTEFSSPNLFDISRTGSISDKPAVYRTNRQYIGQPGSISDKPAVYRKNRQYIGQTGSISDKPAVYRTNRQYIEKTGSISDKPAVYRTNRQYIGQTGSISDKTAVYRTNLQRVVRELQLNVKALSIHYFYFFYSNSCTILCTLKITISHQCFIIIIMFRKD